MRLSLIVNSQKVTWDCEPGTLLRDLLRSKGVLSVKNGCDGEGSCGLCAVLVNGKSILSCTLLAAQVEDCELVTAESPDYALFVIQKALIECSCVQCGYCTPAVSLAIYELIRRSPSPSRDEIKDSLSGTLCRCTGYEQFFEAAQLAARWLQDPMAQRQNVLDYGEGRLHIGKDREKIDAAYLAKGEAAFVEDRIAQDCCHAELITSPHAHAWIKSIDTEEAERIPGVVMIVHHENCPSSMYTTAGQGYPEPSPYDMRMFSRKVRFVGDRVAVVLAESEAVAKEAAALVKVDYEVLDSVLNIEKAKSGRALAIHSGDIQFMEGEPSAGMSVKGDGRDDPVIYQFPIHADPHRNLAASATGGIGDVKLGLAQADVVIERQYSTPRVHCTPLEPHVVYTYLDQNRLVIRASTQVPWHVRRIVARALDISENRIRVIKERVGGGFGVKQDIVVEDIASYLTWKTRKAVFFRYTRAQEFVSSRTRHPMTFTITLGAKKSGVLTAISMKVDADTGAYGQHCLTVPMNSISKSLPLIICPNASFEVKSWYTNLPSSGAYQGYGAPQGSFALQTALAELASELGIDQIELLEKNMVRSGTRIEILRSLGEGRPGEAITLGTCALDRMLDLGKKAFSWKAGTPIQQDHAKSLPASGSLSGSRAAWKIGEGAVIVQQGSGLPGLDAANAQARLLSDGTILMLSGGADLGTGLDTITAKAAAEILCLDMEDVSVVSGDTDTTPFDKGAYASSGTFFSGNAALKAALDLKGKILTAAANLLAVPESELSFEYRGMVHGKKSSISLAKIARHSVQGDGFHELVGFGSFKTLHAAIPYGAHFARVAVECRTGEVRVLAFHVYQDCGTPLNPGLAQGQIYGGVLKAIGHALYEEMLFDNHGRCLNPYFLDYKIPSIKEVPADFHVEFVPVADEVGPFGGKSISEIAVNGAAPTIAIAIHKATGAWVREWPFTPERILKALDAMPAPAGKK